MDWFTKSYVLAWLLMGILLFIGIFFNTPFFVVAGKVFAILNLPVVTAMAWDFIKSFKEK